MHFVVMTEVGPPDAIQTPPSQITAGFRFKTLRKQCRLKPKLQSRPLHRQEVGKDIELNFLGNKYPSHPHTVIHNDLLSNSGATLPSIKLVTHQPSLQSRGF